MAKRSFFIINFTLYKIYQQGRWYWYSYCYVDGKRHKIYVGKAKGNASAKIRAWKRERGYENCPHKIDVRKEEKIDALEKDVAKLKQQNKELVQRIEALERGK